MKKEPLWLDVQFVLALHTRLLDEFGGAAGVRDMGLLESALFRARQAWHYEHRNLFELAATYAAGIVKDHPFTDGNKRTGFMAAYAFLGDNGLEFEADETEVVTMTAGLASKTVSEAEYAAWLRKGCR